MYSLKGVVETCIQICRNGPVDEFHAMIESAEKSIPRLLQAFNG